jgi:hypothetical protein
MTKVTPSQGFPHAEEPYDPTKLFGKGATVQQTRSYPPKPAPLDIIDDRAKYRLAKDILLAAGTEVIVEAVGVHIRYETPHATILQGIDKDHTAEWAMDLADALELGLVEKIPDAE